ncbi:unnamed protein product [Prorocentrum cordatum]|uniref:Sacsin/Nov domain-containing protein n=1 Tax=Prorocentrum cordatum TaxID=2364126 RepID=A0ABN9Y5J9_9DINO|nr:unnamed protein product [Polarella glacialis]
MGGSAPFPGGQGRTSGQLQHPTPGCATFRFKGVFGCDLKSPFKGSIIRASLRREERAKTCTFMPQAFDLSRAKRIFQEFEDTLKDGEVILFLTNVAVVELWRWDPGSPEPTRITTATLGVSSGHKLPRAPSGPGVVKRFLERFDSFGELEKELRKDGADLPEIFDVVDMKTENAKTGVIDQHRWMRYGCFTQQKEIVGLVESCKCVPMAALAMPLGHKTEGSLFASLPLPLTTRLPIHVNGWFRLHDNRRGIWRLRSDLDGEHRLWGQWNDLILTSFVPKLYSQALQCLAELKDVSNDYGHSCWPTDGTVEKEFVGMINPLVANLKDMAVLPSAPTGKLVKPGTATYFPTPSPALQACRARLLELCAEAGWVVVDPPEHVVNLLHSRKALSRKTCTEVFLEVVLPAAPRLPEQELATLLLAFLEWAGSWKEAEVRDFAKKMVPVRWVPSEDGAVRTVADSFDPAHSPEALRVVRERRAKIGALIDAGKLKAETVWHVLGLCGMKKEITWEDAVDEAGTIVQDGSVERSRLLFERLNQQHSKLLGSRAACLSKLKEIPWAPVVEANPASEPKQPSKLLALKEVFPEAARKLVWAVAPSLCLVSAVDELRPGRKVEDEPDVLVDQVRALADGVASNGKGTPAYAPAETLEHLKVVFGALLGLLSKLKNFKEHPKLKGVAFVPCQTTDESDKGAWLFASESAAFQAHRKGSELSPVIGLVKQADQTIKMIAEAAGVAKEPRSEMLMQALAKSGAAAPGLELAVALASELAARTKAQGKKLEHAMVPTVKGTIESMKHVFINDAPWWHQRGVVTLHPGVTAEEGSILGCTSLREEMARRCEGKDAAPAPSKEEATNEAEGVSKLRKLLQEFGDGANIISEFVQNCDGAGAGSVAFFLMEEAFPGEKILDPRASPLQGAALYVCSDKALSAEDVKKMQAMGHLREDARPGCLQGDFGVGLSFMYRYSDCPQLLSGKRVHFFDLSRGFAARPGMAWGRHFSQEQLKEDFPDSYAPFEAKLVAGKFPTVFRLALRTKRSDLGLNLELSTVREELRKAAASGDKTLLFTRSVRRLEFRDGDALVAAHEKSTKDSKGYAAFCSGLRAPVSDLKSGEFVQHLAHKTVKTQLPETAASAEWVVIHRMGVKDDAMKGVVKELAGKGGRGALPHAAAAFRVSPVEEDLQGGKVCCGSPLPLGCNASAWVSAGFALPPSRKTLPLPEPKDSKPSPDQRWNKMLLEGPVAESIQGLVTHCTEGFLSKSLSSQGYFSLFPKPGDLLQSILSSATVSLDWIASTLVNPETSQLSSEHLASLTLGLLEWAGSWKESEVKELSQKLASTKWLPTEDGSLRTICDVFDPAIPVKAFRIVKDKLAKIDGLIENMKLDAPTVWRVLRLCGIKQDITWEDAVDEAEIIAAESDLDAAKGFLAHLNKCHSSMKGSRADALRKLQGLAWAPAMQPCSGQEPKDSLKLTLLKDVYPQSARKLTWAVAPALCMESAVSELKPGLSVDANAEVLVDQIRALAGSVESTPGAPPLATAALVEHLRTAFGALLPLLPKLSKPLAEHPKLSDVAFVPCFPLEEDDGCAALFVPGRAAFQAQHAHRALYPVVGIVKPADSTQKMIAEAAGVAKEPRAPALAEALRGAPKGDLGVALAIELAARIRAKEETPDNIMVPTAGGTIQPVNEVFIDDAPWKHRASRITTLNARISAEDGAILGCTSLRDEMARQAEDEEGATEADKAAQEEDGFGQEADLVAQVKQLLQEYGDHADLVQEFVQNTDDAGAREMAFFLDESEFGKETIVDSRAAELQGPALYIGSDKPLTAYDIGRMQCVGNSAKRMDWTSSGRFGVGLNVMYRYCDCPQLMANDRLHFFDLTRSFVAHGGGKRGRQFTVQKLRENFPDNHSPFEIDMAKRFPTIFRMALRPKRSDLGVKMPLTTIREELKMAADLADKMLLFAKNLRKLEFWDGKKLIAAHEANLQDREGYESYMKSLPKSPIDLKPGVFNSYLGSKIITTERSVQVAEGDDEEKAAPAKVTAEWALSFRVGITDDKMFRVLKEQFEQPHGVALLPSAAAAVKVSPVETGKREGRICSGLPTPFRSNSSAWINGAFALLSSRKTLPLPEEKDQRPSLDKAWNRMLLQGPAAEAMRGLICHSTSLVLYRGFTIDQYFEIFPLRGDRLQSILAISTLKAAVKEAMFPVSRTDKVSWVAGPAPLFKTKELPEDVQEELIADGMKLVYLPDKLLIEYEEALGRPKSVLKAEDLCTFLKETWAKLHPDKDPSRVKTGDAFDDFTKEDLTLEDGSKEVDFDNTGIASLATKEYVTKLLAFAMKGLWASQCKAEKEKKDPETKFAVRALVGVPLLLTHQQCLTPFGLSTKFNSWRDILPAKKNLFIDRELHIAAMDVVDVGLAGASDLVIETTLPGVRPFTLKDLLPFRDAVEASFDASSGFMDGPNESLRQFWSLVADTFAQSLQVNANLGQAAFMKARAAAAGEKAESLIQLKNDASWSKDIMDWRVLPICSSEGLGESGENLVPLSQGGKCVALTLVSQDESIIDSLTGILQECGVDTVQHDIMSDDRIQRLIRTLVVTTNEDMLDLLITHGKIENLSALQRHELLAYFSMLCVKGGVRLDAVRKLALFKTIDVDTKFVAFKVGQEVQPRRLTRASGEEPASLSMAASYPVAPACADSGAGPPPLAEKSTPAAAAGSPAASRGSSAAPPATGAARPGAVAQHAPPLAPSAGAAPAPAPAAAGARSPPVVAQLVAERVGPQVHPFNLGSSVPSLLGGAFSFMCAVRMDGFGNWSRVFDFSLEADDDSITAGAIGLTQDLHFTVFRGRRPFSVRANNFFEPGRECTMLCTVSASGHMRVLKDGALVGENPHGLAPLSTWRPRMVVGGHFKFSDQVFRGSLRDLKVWDQEVSWSDAARS